MARQALAEKYLKSYIEQAWHIVEPKSPFVSGWHIDAMCEHLEAVSRREISRLIINIPPRHMKSLEVCVFWPTWEWGPNARPDLRWLFSSYAETLSTRDSLKCRRIIQSKWYQDRWGHAFYLVGDQNAKTRFENNERGYRIATTVRGVGTGEGGDNIVVDDPHNVLQGESELRRSEVLTWWDESMSTRGNNPKTVAKVIIMQRVNENDLSGHVLEKDLGYTHLCLPARYEGNRVKTSVPLGKPFEDPRFYEGEPLWPERYPEPEFRKLEKDLGSEYAIAGQLQQRPSPRGGGMFKIENFQVINELPHERALGKTVRYWDKAGTEGGGKRTAGVKMSKWGDSFLIRDVVKGQWAAGKREKIIKNIAELDTKSVEVWVEQEPGSGGKESAENTIKNLAGFTCKKEAVTGAKEVRAEPYGGQVEISNIYVLNRPWTQDFIAEHEHFPNGKFNDQVDAASGAFNKINSTKKKVGTW